MSRDYFIDDAHGRRRLEPKSLPLAIGGKDQADIVLPGVEPQHIYAYIALSDGHAYLQAAKDANTIFLNDEKLLDSVWLKSGDQIQIGNARINWMIQGDKVLIDVIAETLQPTLNAPLSPPPASRLNEMPVQASAPIQTSTNKGLKIAGYSSVLILLLASLFLLMATPVMIQLDPEAESLEMRGFPPPVTLWNSRLALPGQYTIDANRQGYFPLKEQITIHMGEQASFRYQLKELPGQLKISVEPERPYQLFIDETATPFNDAGSADISRGTHLLRLEAERYLAHEQTIDISGYGKSQQLTIELKPAWANATISSLPEGASVNIDGKAAGTTPLNTEILHGSHEIELKLKGYKAAHRTEIFVAGETRVLDTFSLEVVDGQVIIESQPHGASISVDSIFHGRTPTQLNLTANTEHRVQLSKSGYHLSHQTIVLKPDEARTLNVTLKAEQGIIFLSTDPANASLLIDGKVSTTQSGRIRLSTQPHTFKLSKTGYVTQELTVTPNTAGSQNIFMRLKTEQQQAVQKQAAATPALITSKANQTLQLIEPDASFNMGASRREAGRRANESRRLIRLQRPFYFAAKEVSNQEYRQFQAAHDSGMLDGVSLNSDPQPVVNISWDEAARYCNWLSQQQGLPQAYTEENGKMHATQPINTGYRLPTEAEWAWIARRQGQSQLQRYPWPGHYPPKAVVGNFADAQIADTLADVIPGYDDGYRGTAPAGSFDAFPDGIYDMGGNAAEWMHDYYALYPGEADKLRTDPSGPISGTHHVVRGSGWRHGSITELRSSYRDYSSKPRYDLGFRIARYAK